MTYPVIPEYEGIPAEYQSGAQWVSAPQYQGGGYYSNEAGQQYDYAQLEKLWEDAGGSKSSAPEAAYIAEYDESGGYSGAWNSTGATGLWQVEWPANYAGNRQDLFTPLENAQVAVQMYEQSGWAPWGSDAKENLNIPPASVVPDEDTPVPGGTAAGSNSSVPSSAVASLLGVTNTSDALQRLGLILLGGALILLGVFMLANKQAVKLVGEVKGAA